MTNTISANFGFVFTYEGYTRNNQHLTHYTVLATTPEELYAQMSDWHIYGNAERELITPNANFRAIINAIFSGDGQYRNVNGMMNDTPKRDIKTTGCGCFGINYTPALAATLDEHLALVRKAEEDAKAERIRLANEKTAELRKEFNEVRRGWYYVEIDFSADTSNGHRVFRTFSGYTIADSKMDAYNKALYNDIKDLCASRGLIFERATEWNGSTTDVRFVGLKTDDGFSVEAWEEYMNNQK